MEIPDEPYDDKIYPVEFCRKREARFRMPVRILPHLTQLETFLEKYSVYTLPGILLIRSLPSRCCLDCSVYISISKRTGNWHQSFSSFLFLWDTSPRFIRINSSPSRGKEIIFTWVIFFFFFMDSSGLPRTC